MSKATISAIAAMAKNRVIGKDGGMPWHLPADLKHFRKTTMGKPIIMGRKSYESLGRPLPGRINIVVSRSYKCLPDNHPTKIFREMEPLAEAAPLTAQEEPHFFTDIKDAIEFAQLTAASHSMDEVFITGGGEIYKQTLPLTDRLYLTVIDREYDGDTYFPEFDWNDWKIVGEQKHEGDPAFTFFTLERK